MRRTFVYLAWDAHFDAIAEGDRSLAAHGNAVQTYDEAVSFIKSFMKALYRG